MQSKQTVAILYGIAEGRAHGKRFRQALQNKGYVITDDVQAATIVIAHSAGTFYLPKPNHTQTVVCIGATYWPGRNPGVQWSIKFMLDILLTLPRHPLFFIRKTAWNLWYLANLGRTFDILHRYKTFNFPDYVARAGNILTIRNALDPWLTPSAALLKTSNARYSYRQIPGQHDDCWRNPEPYIDLIQSLYE